MLIEQIIEFKLRGLGLLTVGYMFSYQARSQKFAMEGCFGDLGAKPPAAGGWG